MTLKISELTEEATIGDGDYLEMSKDVGAGVYERVPSVSNEGITENNPGLLILVMVYSSTLCSTSSSPGPASKMAQLGVVCNPASSNKVVTLGAAKSGASFIGMT